MNKKRNKSEDITDIASAIGAIAGFFMVIYLFLSLIGLYMGLIDSKMIHSKPCARQSNLSTAFPAYRFGCWLGEERK